MKKIKLIVELKHSATLEQASHELSMTDQSAFSMKSVFESSFFTVDTEFGVAENPNLVSMNPDFLSTARYESSGEFTIDPQVENNTYILRGEVDEENLESFEAEMAANSDVVGIYSDVSIEPQLVCPGSAPVGNSTTVENLLCVPGMKAKGMTGQGVYVAIVDTGINMSYLNSKGKNPGFNAAWSWKPSSSSVTPGNAPVGHGTMCAYDVCIAAPQCTLLDIALLTTQVSGPTIMSGFLSDAIKAYDHLIKFFTRVKRPGENPSLVVNNSWGMFHPSWDFPVGHPGNFSHNPNHPFNLIVKKLSQLGADILFAAGNCGPECPDSRCKGVTNGGIYGANSSPYVTTVAGVATNFDRVGYSNKGPGCLTDKKPDITGYTHFSGSGVYSSDGGTSAACPVVAGVYAAIRTRRPFNPGSAITSPASIKNLVTSTAKDLGATGWDYYYGYGVVDGCKIIKKLFPVLISICQKYPKICELMKKDKLKFDDICKKYPIICKGINRDDFIIPKDIPLETFESEMNYDVSEPNFEYLLDMLEMVLGGSPDFDVADAELSENPEEKDCNCGSK